MITFKQFLAEVVLTSWEESSHKVNETYDAILKNPGALKAIASGNLIYRGFNNMTAPVVKINATNSKRTSRDSNNAYQLMMDASKSLSGFPKRSESLICSTDFRMASAYGPHKSPGSTRIIIPHNGTKVAHSHVEDFLISRLENLNEFFWSVSNLNMVVTRLLYAYDCKPTSGKFLDIDVLDEAVSKGSAELFVMILSCVADRPFITGVHPRLTKNSRILSAAVFDAVDDPEYKEIIEMAIASIKEQGTGNPLGDELLSAARKNPSKRLTAISSVLMTPEILDLGLVSFGEKLPDEVECWMSGEVLAITATTFAPILERLIQEGHDVSQDLVNNIIHKYGEKPKQSTDL